MLSEPRAFPDSDLERLSTKFGVYFAVISVHSDVLRVEEIFAGLLWWYDIPGWDGFEIERAGNDNENDI